MIPTRHLAWIFAGAFALRAGFALWAPGIVSGDDLWYHARAAGIAAGAGYIELDGSPSITWMPGWPLLLGGLYALLGAQPAAGFALNALLGALTSVLLAACGARLLSPRVGVLAGVIYAIWPGNVFYAATLMSESLFNTALVTCLLLLSLATAPQQTRPGRWIAGAGVAFGSMALVKAEPLILAPVCVACIALGPWGARRSVQWAALFLLVAGVVLSPWVVRNYLHFGRVVVTTGSGPANAWLGHHAGASGGQSLATAIAQARHLREHPEASGYRLAWEFARSHPREELSLSWKKLRLTYASDDDAVTLIRGVRPRERRHLPLATELRLRRLANLYWGIVAALFCAGLFTLRAWPGRARVLVLGVPACWLLLHVVFIGGPRFHVPETPSIALVAGAGFYRLRDALSRRRALRGSPRGSRPAPVPAGASPDRAPPTA